MNKAPELQKIIQAQQSLGYKVFDNDSRPYNLNIVGLRTDDTGTNTFNDLEYIFWKYQGSWECLKFQVTTDPGLYYLKSPMNELGTAIVKPGQYPGMWSVGKHLGKYNALVQSSPCTVIRDFNRDEYLNYNSGREETGIFGINNHRAIENGRSLMVDKWSAGCIVFGDYYQFEIFMRIVSEAVKNWTPTFTFTLLTSRDIIH